VLNYRVLTVDWLDHEHEGNYTRGPVRTRPSARRSTTGGRASGQRNWSQAVIRSYVDAAEPPKRLLRDHGMPLALGAI
jgi:hypothetical protein